MLNTCFLRNAQCKQVPIAVRVPGSNMFGANGFQQQGGGLSSDWRIVTWIDSKATFGDERTHVSFGTVREIRECSYPWMGLEGFHSA